MSPTWVVRFLAFVDYAVCDNPLVGAENQLLRISLPSNVSRLISPLNRSSTPGDIPTENDLDIKCGGSQYGVNLNIADCKEATGYISSGSQQYPWVKRHTHILKPYFAVPYRSMGGKYRCPYSSLMRLC